MSQSCINLRIITGFIVEILDPETIVRIFQIHLIFGIRLVVLPSLVFRLLVGSCSFLEVSYSIRVVLRPLQDLGPLPLYLIFISDIWNKPQHSSCGLDVVVPEFQVELESQDSKFEKALNSVSECAIQTVDSPSHTMILVPKCQDIKHFECKPAVTNVSP